jgi:hypothetical protein
MDSRAASEAQWLPRDALHVLFKKMGLHRTGGSLARCDSYAQRNYRCRLRYDFATNTGSPWAHLTRVVRYIRSRFPVWDLSGGADHITWQTGDVGHCAEPYMEPHLLGTDSYVRIGHYCFQGRCASCLSSLKPTGRAWPPFGMQNRAQVHGNTAGNDQKDALGPVWHAE